MPDPPRTHIGVLIPCTSKGRDEWVDIKSTYLYNMTVKTLFMTQNDCYDYTFYVGYDTGDRIFSNPAAHEEISRLSTVFKNMRFQFIDMKDVSKGHVTAMWNILFQRAYDTGCDYFYQCGDDIVFHTKGWTRDCIVKLESHDGYGLAGPINNNNRILTQAFVSRRHMEVFGFFFPEEIINWCCDDWYNETYYPTHLFPLRSHYCTNNGGAPRYTINNDPTYEADVANKTMRLRQETSVIAQRDRKVLVAKMNAGLCEPSSFSTMCTSNCAFELIGLLLSLSVFHPNARVYLLCDSKTKKIINEMTPVPRLDIRWFVELDMYDGMNRQTMTARGIWGTFQMAKATVIRRALEESPDTLFLDSDILVTGVIKDIDMTKELGVSPQYITQEHVNKTGYYNGGMLWTKNKNVPDDWIRFTKTSRYFDQASIEDLARKYSHFSFGENYNLQCWRLLLSDDPPEKIASYITSVPNEGLYYKGLPLKFVHTHFLDKRFGQFNDLIIRHMKLAKMYKTLAIAYRVIHNKWVLKIPKQPMSGMGRHANDSYRELVTLISKNTPDVDVVYSKDSIHCWLEPNILTYDRPTLEWCDNQVLNSSLVLLGNGDVKVEGAALSAKYPSINVQPWIFWPRRPSVAENILRTKGILSHNERQIESIFIGNYENSVQEKFRNANVSWDSVVSEYHCTKGTKHKFTHEEYLMKLRDSRYGLCLRGYGSKCHREVELMAFGTVPIITPGVTIESYMEPPVEGTHYLRVKSPKEFTSCIEAMDIDRWRNMSKACFDWYQRNVHSDTCWQNMIDGILYDM
jgi:hypothetical protein